MSAPFVSVIVPVYNDPERLSACLHALAAQDYPADRFEVLVVDNASTEDVRPAIPPGDPRFRLLHEGRRGSYAARNAGVAAAAGDLLAFTDADCRPRPDWIRTGVTALGTEPVPDAVAGRIQLVFRGGAGPTTAPELYESLHEFQQAKYVDRWGWAATANVFVTAEAFHRVGSFDARLRSGGDMDWGTRLTGAGGVLRYEPSVVVEHPSRPSWTEMARKAIRVADGLASHAEGTSRRTLARRAFREAKGGMTVWVRVWRDPIPDRVPDKFRYAGAYCCVSLLRSAVRLRRMLTVHRTPA
jgi:glycosyltransferase involved in cell wall biosynthesis